MNKLACGIRLTTSGANGGEIGGNRQAGGVLAMRRVARRVMLARSAIIDAQEIP